MGVKACVNCSSSMPTLNRAQRAQFVCNDCKNARQRIAYKVRKALERGIIQKGTECAECGRDDLELVGHHHKGYEPEHVLDLLWLCRADHARIHCHVVQRSG